MSKGEDDPKFFWFKLVSVVLFLLCLTGLLGALGVSVGRPFYFLFKAIFGNNAWIGLVFCFIAAIMLWVYSSRLSSSVSGRSIKSDTETNTSIKSEVSSGSKLGSGSRSRSRSRSGIGSRSGFSAEINSETSSEIGSGNRTSLSSDSDYSSRRAGKRRRTSPEYQSPGSRTSNFKQNFDSKEFSLPAGKLVSLKGFKQYFSSPEWVEMKEADGQKAEDLKEIGKDFPSYFGTGEPVISKRLPKITSLKGLKDYIVEVDQEVKSERELNLEQEIPRQGKVTPQKESCLHTEKPPRFSSVFKSQADQEEFLAQFKEDGKPLNYEEIDLVDNLKENSRTIAEAQKIAQVVEKSVPSKEFAAELISIFVPEIMPEIMPGTNTETGLGISSDGSAEPSSDLCSELKTSQAVNNPETASQDESENDLVLTADFLEEEISERASTSFNMLEFEVPVAAAADLKPNYAGQVAQLAQLADQMQVQPEGTEQPLAESIVERVEDWQYPDLNLLEPVPPALIIQETETPKQLETILLDFGVKAKVIRVTRGPVITRYELAPAPGVKISKIVNLSDDIALGLAARDVRIEAPIPGKAAIGIEVPNKQSRAVPFREVLETASFEQYPSKLKIALGKDIADQPIIADLIKMPHLLVAGATGSGKSVCITTIINSILFNATPDEVKFLLVDPKMVELSQYNGIPHLLAPVVIDPKKAASALKWIVKEMENRYELFAAAGVRDIERYNKVKAEETNYSSSVLPLIVVIIDELADLMLVAAGEVEEAICRLAQMARAAGIHLVIATQRPSVDVITGVIKANIPSRISFAVSSQIDSRTILDATGAEKLLGRGDMLYSPLGVNKALRVQGCLVTDDEVQRVIAHWKGLGLPEYLDPERLFAEQTLKNEESNGPDDALFLDAGRLFIRTKMASVSYLQRRLKLGYTRAARLMDMLEEQGVVGAYEGSKPRQVLLTLEEFEERFG